MDSWIRATFRTLFPGMTEFAVILQFLCPRGLERAVRQRRDAPRRTDLRLHEAHRLADHAIVLQPFLKNKIRLGQGHDDLADLGAGFEVLMGCQIFVQPIKNAVDFRGKRA